MSLMRVSAYEQHAVFKERIFCFIDIFLSGEVIYQMGVAFLVFRLAEAMMADARGHTPIRRSRHRSGWFPEAVGKGRMKERLLLGSRSSHRATGTFGIRYKCWLYTFGNVLNATKSHVKWLFLSFVNFAG